MRNNALSNTGIRRRLFYGFSTIISVFVLSVMVSVYFIHEAESDAAKFLKITLPVKHAITDIQTELTNIEMALPSLVIFNDLDVREFISKEFNLIDSFQLEISGLLKNLDESAVSDKWSISLNSIATFKNKINKLNVLIDAGSKDKALEYYRSDIIPYITFMNDTFNVDITHGSEKSGVIDTFNQIMISDMTQISHQVYTVLVVSVAFLLLSIIISYIVASISSRSILRPILYANDIAKNIAAGKRSIEINVRRNDETGELLKSLSIMRDAIIESEAIIEKRSEENKRLYDSVVRSAKMFSAHASRVSAGELNKRLNLQNGEIDQEIMLRLGHDLNNMTENLSSVTNDIVNACSSMVSTLSEVRCAVDAQSSGASEQASSINQITASITQIEKSSSQTMSKAKDLGGIAEKTRKNGQLGLDSIETSVQGMKGVRDKVQMIAQTILDLSRQTQQVGEITSVVNNLAQQSKMLALNASIEAAKAGEAGRGFAVVASEVKNLAEQSEQSTEQVQKILEDIKVATEKAVMVTEEGTKGVDSGLLMIERTGVIIKTLNEVIREAAIASQQIESAVRQESAGIEQITAGMNEINIVTASFVESVSQTTEAMENLSSITNKLKSSVEAYKL